MGLNAVTSVYDFTAGQVLTAAQMDNVNCGIPVFATTVTRDAAFGGTGEKVLAEGQYAYIEASNETQFYDGSAWQTLGGGLTVVKAQTTFTAASSVSADNVFTSSYRNYSIVIENTGSVNGSNLLMRLRVGGVAAATNYNYQILFANSSTVGGSLSSSQTSCRVGSNDTTFGVTSISLFSPQIAQATTINGQNNYTTAAYTAPILYLFSSNHSTATAYDGVEFFPSSGTITGTYTIYGWGK